MIVARLATLRVLRSTEARLAVLGYFFIVLASAWFQHRSEAPHGADHALTLYRAIAVPLLAYAVVAAAFGEGGLTASARALVRLGASPVRVARSSVSTVVVTTAALSGLLGALTAVLGHGSSDPPIVHDALLTFAIGALAGAAYAGYLSLAGALLASFWGRAAFLILDWVLGSGDGLGSLFTPRAHLRSLLGGDAPFDALPWESFVALAIMAALAAVLAISRSARSR